MDVFARQTASTRQPFVFVALLAMLYRSVGQNASYCLPNQRFDVGAFPPRCIDCTRVLSNRMQVTRIPTTLLTRRAVQKFSPGLPQNQTCGCWRAPVNQTVFDVVLNASWIVSGLSFHSDRRWWIKEVEVQASDNNRTYIPWGVYSMSNFTSASLTLFSYPIRARFFRVTVRKYANHYVNSTAGFPLSPVRALVSHDQPFGCACPMLSNGECCPFLNMTIRNDRCVWCMDPADIKTNMVDGCAKCKAGTFEFEGRCYQSAPPARINSLSIGNPSSDGVKWRIQVNYTTDPQSALLHFIANKTAVQRRPCVREGYQSSALVSACCLHEYYNDGNHSPILWNFAPSPPLANESATFATAESCRIESILDPPSTVKQFVQFDRGRQSATLSFSEKELRTWASCDDLRCTGFVGALFLTLMSPPPIAAFLPQLIQQPLQFEKSVPPLVCTTSRALPQHARAELHYYASTDIFVVRILGVELNGEHLRFQWTNTDEWTVTPNAPEPVVTGPPTPSAALRIGNDINMLRIDPPISPVIHDAVRRSAAAGILVEVVYGFGFKELPASGDTDQIVIITAKSTQPTRLKRLATSRNGETTTYTNAKGFISDPRRAMDLGVACYQDSALMVKWLLQAIQLLDTPGIPHVSFVQRSCRMVLSGEVAKAFWLAPWRGALNVDRRSPAGVEVVAEFA
jgi:hypothetical protein